MFHDGETTEGDVFHDGNAGEAVLCEAGAWLDRWYSAVADPATAEEAPEVVLVAGLTFATLSISKRNTSRPAEMEPLTTQQEVLLGSDTKMIVVQDEESKDTMKEDSCLSNTGIDNDSSLSIENNEATDENRQSGSDVGYTFNSGDGITNDSIQEDLQNESAIDDMSVAPDRIPGTPQLPESEIVYGSVVAFEKSDSTLVAEKSESATELKENLIDAKHTNSSVSDANPTNLNTDTDSKEGVPAPSVVSAALQVLPGKLLVPAVVDQVQGQALAALQTICQPEIRE